MGKDSSSGCLFLQAIAFGVYGRRHPKKAPRAHGHFPVGSDAFRGDGA